MPYLVLQPGEPDEKVWELRSGSNTIGRGHGNSILITDGGKGLSRHHAEINLMGNRAILTDLGSRNGTFVEEIKITMKDLSDGDRLRLGATNFQFFHQLPTPKPVEDAGPELTIIGRLTPEQARIDMVALLDKDSGQLKGPGLRLRQQDNAQRTADKLKILLEVSKQLSSPESADKLLEKILDLLFEIMAVDRAVILMLNEEQKTLEQRATKTRSHLPLENHFYSTRITNYVFRNGEAILTNDASIDARFDSSDSILFQTIQACMCTPLKPRDHVLGVLYVDNISMPNTYAEEDLEFLTALANQAAIAIENATLYKKMQSEAVIRAKLERFFPQAVSRKIEEEGDLKIVDTEVTALFSDITGFTEISSRMEPRQILEMLNEYFKVMVEEIVFRYEGTLEKYIADALLAVWGAPYSKPDDTNRAVWAAIEMQWAVQRLNQQWRQQRNLEIRIHVGLNSGPVAAGNIGSQNLIQYATIGDAMNVASRICSAAQPGEILISQTTLDRIGEDSLPVEKMPLVKVKGKADPLQLYRVRWDEVVLWDDFKPQL